MVCTQTQSISLTISTFLPACCHSTLDVYFIIFMCAGIGGVDGNDDDGR